MSYKRLGSFLANVAALITAFLITYVMKFGWEPDERAFQNVNDAMVFAFLLFSFLMVFMIYRPKATTPGKRGLFSILKDSFIMTLGMAAVFSTVIYAAHVNDAVPRMFFIYFFATNYVFAVFYLEALNLVIRGVKKRNARKTVVVTDAKDRTAVIRKLLREGRDDMDVVGVIAMSETRKSVYYQVKTFNEAHKKMRKTAIVEIDPALLKFEFERADMDSLTFLKRHQIDRVIIAVEHWNRDKIRELVDEVAEMGIDTIVTLESLAMDEFDSKLEDFGTTQVLRIAPRIFTDGEMAMKRVMDVLGAIVGCAVCAVVGIFVVPLIFISDPGPVIFKQKRVGKNGKYFYIYKFRSMYKDAEARLKDLQGQNEMDGMMFKMKNDPRITKVGKFIRKTSIDELPQFFNVLKGDMSLVGTRPPTVDEYNQYSRHHKRRLTLKPGITGLWQVSGRSQITDFEDVVRLDCYYIDHWSILYDIKILFMTVGAVFTGKGSE